MAYTYTRVTVTPVNHEKGKTTKFLVDTGATDSSMPEDILLAMGIEPKGTMRYELADGRKVSYHYGAAEFTVMGRTTWGRIVFAPVGSEPLLGVTVLESTALRVNPVTKKLEKLPAALLK
jgi:clan AA aspartic protease